MLPNRLRLLTAAAIAYALLGFALAPFVSTQSWVIALGVLTCALLMLFIGFVSWILDAGLPTSSTEPAN